LNTLADPAELPVARGWAAAPDKLLAAVRACVSYAAGEDRATGILYGEGRRWPEQLATFGPALLDELERQFGVRFEIVAFQGYLDGAGCDWHADTPFGAQAVLSLGVSRTFGTRPAGGEPAWWTVEHGDLFYMPAGFQTTHEHCVPVEDIPGERISLVFRTAVRG
jgi:alkylated DNA repair dioxygenase AlkB